MYSVCPGSFIRFFSLKTSCFILESSVLCVVFIVTSCYDINSKSVSVKHKGLDGGFNCINCVTCTLSNVVFVRILKDSF